MYPNYTMWSGSFSHFGPLFTMGILVVVAWSLTWKGLALWRAGRRGDMAWFIVLLIVNTVGILEIIYLLITRPGKGDAHHPHHHSHTSLIE